MENIKNYFDYAKAARELLEAGRNLATDRGENPPSPQKKCGKKLVMFAPHPDDEIITGLLPLRLMNEKGWKITDAAVSLGSNVARRTGRIAELANAMDYLGWKLEILGFDRVRPDVKTNSPEVWKEYVGKVAALIEKESPDALTIPHKDDANAAHIATGMIVRDALKLLGIKYKGVVIETEVWSGMEKPNLLIEAGEMEMAWLMTALSRHVKEVERNDYHARLPHTFAEYVRRGAEIVGTAGAAAPKFNFGCIYAVRKFNGESWIKTSESKFVGLHDDIETILK